MILVLKLGKYVVAKFIKSSTPVGDFFLPLFLGWDARRPEYPGIRLSTRIYIRQTVPECLQFQTYILLRLFDKPLVNQILLLIRY